MRRGRAERMTRLSHPTCHAVARRKAATTLPNADFRKPRHHPGAHRKPSRTLKARSSPPASVPPCRSPRCRPASGVGTAKRRLPPPSLRVPPAQKPALHRIPTPRTVTRLGQRPSSQHRRSRENECAARRGNRFRNATRPLRALLDARSPHDARVPGMFRFRSRRRAGGGSPRRQRIIGRTQNVRRS